MLANYMITNIENARQKKQDHEKNKQDVERQEIDRIEIAGLLEDLRQREEEVDIMLDQIYKLEQKVSNTEKKEHMIQRICDKCNNIHDIRPVKSMMLYPIEPDLNVENDKLTYLDLKCCGKRLTHKIKLI